MNNQPMSDSGGQSTDVLVGKLHFAAFLHNMTSGKRSEIGVHIKHAAYGLSLNPADQTRLANLLASWAISQRGRDPIEVAQQACNVLATHTPVFEPVRRLTLGEIHFARAIDAYKQGQFAESRRSMRQAWRQRPRLLTNRGSLSMFARTLLPAAWTAAVQPGSTGGVTLADALSEAGAAIGYPLRDAELIAGGYSTDKVFLVHSQASEQLILRISENGFLSERPAVLEIARAAQVPAPRVIAAGQRSKHDPRATWLLEELMPGAAFLPPTMSAAAELSILAELAAHLRRLHVIETRGYGPVVSAKLDAPYPSFAEWFDDLLTGVCFSCTQFDLPANAFATVSRAAAILRAAPGGRPVLCHGDLARGNILVEDGSVKAIIDWEDAVGCDPAYDFAILFTHMSNYWYPERDSGLLSWTLDKYQVGDSSNLRQRIEAYRLLFAVSQLAWLANNDTDANDYALSCAAILSRDSVFPAD